MTLFKPTFRLNRLVIHRAGDWVYDEQFHRGVNIIRGENGSGKSTIAEFIFFLLGGDFIRWKEYAALCDTVMAEVLVNGSPVTLMREVSSQRSRPMRVFWGKLDEASNSAAEGWERYPYSRSKTKESFSQVLFRALDLPEIRGELGANITMHQILRLMYVDQTTPFDRILVFEQFDSPLTRQAIGDYLTGIFDNQLYNEQLELRQLESEFEVIQNQLKNIFLVLGGENEDISAEFLRTALQNRRDLRDKIYASVQELLKRGDERQPESSGESPEAKELAEKFRSITQSLNKLRDHIEQIDYETSDSEYFIEQIKENLVALDESSGMGNYVGLADFTFCPACFSKLDAKVDPKKCSLCGTKLDPVKIESYHLRLKHELSQQLKESEKLQIERENARGRFMGTSKNDAVGVKLDVSRGLPDRGQA